MENYDDYVDNINKNWNKITNGLLKFGPHIHGYYFDAGVYLIEDDVDVVVISITSACDNDIFWGIPVSDTHTFEEIGINTYDILDMVEVLQDPKEIHLSPPQTNESL